MGIGPDRDLHSEKVGGRGPPGKAPHLGDSLAQCLSPTQKSLGTSRSRKNVDSDPAGLGPGLILHF